MAPSPLASVARALWGRLAILPTTRAGDGRACVRVVDWAEARATDIARRPRAWGSGRCATEAGGRPAPVLTRRTAAAMRLLRITAVAAAVVALGVASTFVLPDRAAQTPVFRLATVEQGPIVSTVSSTGRLEPVVTVLVGSQISGQIKEIFVDFNTEVEANEVIARIDPAVFEARVRQAAAGLAVARAELAINTASVDRAGADVDNAIASIEVAEAEIQNEDAAVEEAAKDLARKAELRDNRVVAQAQVDTAQATHDRAVAQRAAARGRVRAARSTLAARQAEQEIATARLLTADAEIQRREAALNIARIDLEHTVIRSPIDGVVVQRQVDIGQTVAASLQAPELFSIAQDLSKMQVEVSVDEADIGRIEAGQQPLFTVDSYPQREFAGRIQAVRLSPEEVDNVVTYGVIASVDNGDRRLLPGMTANVRIVVADEPAAIKIPNAALRYRPEGFANTQRNRGAGPAGRGRGNGGRGARVFVVGADGEPAAVPVTVGISDGGFTALVDGDLTPGQQVIVGANSAADEAQRRPPRFGF